MVQDEQRKRLEEKLRKKNETATAAQAAETLQQEQARLRAEAAGEQTITIATWSHGVPDQRAKVCLQTG